MGRQNRAIDSNMSETILSSLQFDRGQAVEWRSLAPDARMSWPGFSLAVCTYMRCHCLRRFLESLLSQEERPDEVIVVDASPDMNTEQMIVDWFGPIWDSSCVRYVRVGAGLRGLTRQRNLAARLGTRELIGYFDDDVVLQSGCLQRLRAGIEQRPECVGIGATIVGVSADPGLRWHLMKWTMVVPDLVPGRYHRSGFSIPLRLLTERAGVVEVDRLPGGCSLWRRAYVLELGFDEGLEGYGQAEDVEFSLRARKFGRLLIQADAGVLHMHGSEGRPSTFRLGIMGIANRYRIQRAHLADRRFADLLALVYGSVVYGCILTLDYCRRGEIFRAVGFAAGTTVGLVNTLTRRCLRPTRPVGSSDARVPLPAEAPPR